MLRGTRGSLSDSWTHGLAVDLPSTGVALPAAFLRWSIPPDESVVATNLLAIFVGIAALVDRNLRYAGLVQHFELSVFLGL